MRQGEKIRTDDEQAVLEGKGHRTRYQAGITEHMDGAVGRPGYGTSSATVGGCGCRVSTGN